MRTAIIRAVIYCRVSSDTSGRGRSVEEQELECRQICERNGWTVAEVLIDNDMGASRWSKGDNRPAFQRLPEVLQPGDVLVYWEPSRTTRDLGAFVDLRDLCADRGVFWCVSGKLMDPTKGDDRFAAGLDALLAEKEAEQSRERVMRAMRKNASDGRPHGFAPYGYTYVRDPQSGKVTARVPHPEHAPIMQEIATRFLKGESLYAITADLNARNVPTPKNGASWLSSSISQMLKNKTYAGLRTYKGEVSASGNWPPLIDPEEFEKIQILLSDPSRTTNRGRPARHLLTGIAVCGVCGGPLVRLKREPHHRYACKFKRCVTRRQDMVDRVVREAVIRTLSNEPVRMNPDPEGDTDRLRALAEVQALELRLRALSDQFADPTSDMTTEWFFETQKKLNKALEDAKARAQPQVSSPLVSKFMGQDARELWFKDSTTLEEHRGLARELCESIRVMPTSRKRDPQSVEVVVRPEFR